MDLRTTHQDRRIGVDLRGFGCGGAEVFSGEEEGKGVVLRGTEKARSTHKMRLSARFHEGRVRTAFIARDASFGEEAQRRGISSLRSSAHRGRAYLPQLPPGYG